MTNLNILLKQMADILSANESCEPRFEANQLTEFVLGKSRLELGPLYQVSDDDTEKLLGRICASCNDIIRCPTVTNMQAKARK